MLITFEGIEGSGKSTQIQKLATFLSEKGYNIVQTKEPGGTQIGEKLRHMILDPNHRFHHDYTEVLLFFADRLEHIETVIKPALSAKKIVLCDRYMDSTIAYQIGGRGIPESLITSLSHYVTLTPDKTFLLDLTVDEGLRRAKNRSDLDRFEKESTQFHQRIRDKYLEQAKKEPNRIHVIQADNKTIDQLHDDLKARCLAWLQN